MTSETRRDPVTDHLLTPENSAFIIIDYQPIQVSSIRSMDQKELVFNIVSTAKAACRAFPALDALREGHEVYVVADAVGGTSRAAHEAALRRIDQAGGKLISKTQLYCELQRDWKREATVPGFMHVFQNWDGSNPEKDFRD